MSNNIGEKVKYFRERAGLKQLELEKSIEASAGSISRIESGKTNPTKETLDKISKALNLNYTEIMYLNGAFSKFITIKEIENAKKEVNNILLSSTSVAYLIDEKRRVWAVSKGFQKLAGITKEDMRYIIGENVFKIICNKHYSGHKLFKTNNDEQMLVLQLNRLFYQVPYIFSESYWLDLIRVLRKNEIFAKAWDKVSGGKNVDAFGIASRIVNFNFQGYDVNLVYTEETLKNNPRFSIIACFSSTNVLGYLDKFLTN